MEFFYIFLFFLILYTVIPIIVGVLGKNANEKNEELSTIQQIKQWFIDNYTGKGIAKKKMQAIEKYVNSFPIDPIKITKPLGEQTVEEKPAKTVADKQSETKQTEIKTSDDSVFEDYKLPAYTNSTSAEQYRRERERQKMTPKLRYQILKRDNGRCQICGRTAQDGVTLEVDHIKPISKGGKTEPDNLRTLCRDCNRGKAAKYDEDDD